jgi:hypothetical protein
MMERPVDYGDNSNRTTSLCSANTSNFMGKFRALYSLILISLMRSPAWTLVTTPTSRNHTTQPLTVLRPYTFIQNVYKIWLLPQFERICSIIDKLPPEHGLEPQISETSGLSQQLEDHILAEAPGSRSSHSDLQQITPETSTQAEKPASQTKKKEEKV